MYKKIIFLMFALSGFCFAQISPRVSVQQIDYDFGHIKEDTTISHTFIIYNGGGGTLKMSDLKTSCKCLTANLDKYEIGVTDSSDLKAYFNPSGNYGFQQHEINIKTNDPNNPNLSLFISGYVLRPNEKPSIDSSKMIDTVNVPKADFPQLTYDFGEIKQGAVVDHVFQYTNKGKTKLKIWDLRTSCGCTAALLKNKETDPGQDGSIRVEFDSAGKIGKLSRRVSMKTNDPKNPVITIVIFADVEVAK
jgi:Protein of unknown function (DUF1573)